MAVDSGSGTRLEPVNPSRQALPPGSLRTGVSVRLYQGNDAPADGPERHGKDQAVYKTRLSVLLYLSPFLTSHARTPKPKMDAT